MIPVGAGVGYDDAAMDDAELVKAVCEGDRQAFADVYDRYSGNIYAFLCTIMRNREEAADALQDTFLAAGARMHQLRDPSKLRPWLFAIARHNAMHGFSRASKHEPLEDVDVTDPGPDPSELAASSELADLIREAAEGLGDQERIVLGLHLEQGLQGQELGDALGVSAGHAYVLMNRMRQQVERSLGALLVARQGRRECEKLEKLLRPWDGRFSVLWRKRVARHVDGCELCAELRKRLVSPVSMMAVPPLIPAPAEAREFVLDNVRLTGSTAAAGEPVGRDAGTAQPDGPAFGGGEAGARAWPSRYGGFPPPMVRPRRRGASALVAALVLMLFAGPVAGGSESDLQPAASPVPLLFPDSVQSPLDALGGFEASPSPSTLPAGTPPPRSGTAAPSVPKAQPTPTRGVDVTGEENPAPIPSPSPSPVDPSPRDPSPSPEDPSGPAESEDSEAPALSVSVRPRQIHVSGCAGQDDPTRAQVSAAVSDESRIVSVVLSYQGVSKPMQSAGGGSYSGAVGPFEQEGTVTLEVTAQDEHGNTATATGSVQVVCEDRSSPALRAPQSDEPGIEPEGSTILHPQSSVAQ